MIKQIKCCVIDDDSAFLEIFKSKIGEQFRLNHLSCIIDSFADPKQLDLNVKYDVYFLDIEMPDIDGFKLAAQIGKMHPSSYIIFVTAKSELAYISYDLHPFDFIYKGLIDETLAKKIKSLISQFNLYTYRYEYKNVQSDISVNRIIYIEKYLNYIYIHIQNGSKELVMKQRKSIGKVYEELNEIQALFIRINESVLVNKQFIAMIQEKECRLVNHQTLTISRYYLSKVKSMYYTISR